MTEEPAATRMPRPPSALEALIPVVLLVSLVFLGIVLYGGDLVAGPVQVALIFCAVVAGLIGMKNGHAMEDLGKAAVTPPLLLRAMWHSRKHHDQRTRERRACQAAEHPRRPPRA